MTRGVAHRNESSAVTQVSVCGHRASPRSFFFSSPFRTHLWKLFERFCDRFAFIKICSRYSKVVDVQTFFEGNLRFVSVTQMIVINLFCLVDKVDTNRILIRGFNWRKSRGNHDILFCNRCLEDYCTASVIGLINSYFVLQVLTICVLRTYLSAIFIRQRTTFRGCSCSTEIQAQRDVIPTIQLFSVYTRRAVYACNPPFPRASSLRPWCVNGLRSTTMFIKTRTISYVGRH